MKMRKPIIDDSAVEIINEIGAAAFGVSLCVFIIAMFVAGIECELGLDALVAEATDCLLVSGIVAVVSLVVAEVTD